MCRVTELAYENSHFAGLIASFLYFCSSGEKRNSLMRQNCSFSWLVLAHDAVFMLVHSKCVFECWSGFNIGNDVNRSKRHHVSASRSKLPFTVDKLFLFTLSIYKLKAFFFHYFFAHFV